MAKKTAYGTNLTIRQIKSILRKMEDIERREATSENMPPYLMIISYSSEKGCYVVDKDYTKGTGKKKIYDRRVTEEFASLQDCVVPANFLGLLLVELMELPQEQGDMYSFDVGLLRVECGLVHKAFSLEFLGHIEGTTTSEFNILCYE